MKSRKWMIATTIALGFAVAVTQAQNQSPTVANMPPSVVQTVTTVGGWTIMRNAVR